MELMLWILGGAALGVLGAGLVVYVIAPIFDALFDLMGRV